MESNFTRAVQFCKGELGVTKLPFAFVQILMHYATDNPNQLRRACAIYRLFGLWELALRKTLTEPDFNMGSLLLPENEEA